MRKQPFEIIPVLDLKGGIAVRAVAGDRASYRPLATILTAGNDPLSVARGYRMLFPFRTLYVADLDGIEGRGAQMDLQRQLVLAWSGREVWIDDGMAEPRTGATSMPVTKVLGSESLPAPALDLAPPLAPASGVLSLDFKGGRFLGPSRLLEERDLWPGRVIVMTLSQVGGDAGPDVARVSDIVRQAGPGRRVFAAGGVRDIADMRALRDAGAAGALVATALHAGRIKTGDLEEIAGESFQST